MQGPHAMRHGTSALDFAVASRDSKVLDMVRRAIEHREVMLAYQPVVRASDPNRVAFYEGLVRVLDETGRVIPAREFIHAVEDMEYGRLLDCLALQIGLTALKREPTLRLSINLSARSIGYTRWQRILDRALSTDTTLGERLILEITEHSAIVVPELVTSFMGRLRMQGITFALDDFGAGYTALRHFRDFQFDVLKIDGQFVTGIAQSPDDQVLVASMLAIAEQFDMFTVAEAVENADDASVLAQLGVDCLQGYLTGAPTVSPPWQEERQDKRRRA